MAETGSRTTNKKLYSYYGESEKFASKELKLHSFYSPFLLYSGFNLDITSDYYWITNFGHLTHTGFSFIKVEEQEYFTESSQYGQNFRQVKGGAIKAFQENLQQLVQLIKVHLMPLLDEIKKADFYFEWTRKIEESDITIQFLVELYDLFSFMSKDNGKIIFTIDDKKEVFELEDLNKLIENDEVEKIERLIKKQKADKNVKKKTLTNLLNNLKNEKEGKRKLNGYDLEGLKKVMRKRDEAILHLKDKWANEVDGGRIWQISKSENEKGLDFALLPQLFFGVNLENPLYEKHKKGKTLTDQLDEDIYEVDITKLAKEQVARFMYKFYIWLPTAIKDTKLTFKLKISALKQFYSQIHMYINFMKPILIEITKKTERMERGSFFENFSEENPELVNIFDTSYSFIRLWAIRKFEKIGCKLEDLEFTRFEGCLFARKIFIKFGDFKDKSGFIDPNEENGFYKFYPYTGDSKSTTNGEWKKLKDEWKENKTYVDKTDLMLFSLIEINFRSYRRSCQKNTPQGLQPTPYMKNGMSFNCYAPNFIELAIYRKKVKVDNLELLSDFIKELDVIKEDLFKYLNYFEPEIKKKEEDEGFKREDEKKPSKKNDTKGIFRKTASFIGLDIRSKFKIGMKEYDLEVEKNKYKQEALNKSIFHTQKVYRVFKKYKKFWSYSETR
jgi:hypothetical protein